MLDDFDGDQFPRIQNVLIERVLGLGLLAGCQVDFAEGALAKLPDRAPELLRLLGSTAVTLRLLALLAGGVGSPAGTLAGTRPLCMARYVSRFMRCCMLGSVSTTETCRGRALRIASGVYSLMLLLRSRAASFLC